MRATWQSAECYKLWSSPRLGTRLVHSLFYYTFNVADMASKDVNATADSLDGTTPSLRSEELVVGDYGSDSNHVFSDPKVADYWRGVYENAKYEGRHRFDPTLTWSADEEKKLKRRVDWRIMTWCWLMFLALDLNRRNINRGMLATCLIQDTLS